LTTGTFIISRIELERVLTGLGVSTQKIEGLVSALNKMHRHSNAVAFVGMLQKTGLRQPEIANILRRIGIDDVTVTNIFNSLDEERIKSAFGRIVELKVE
jgi:hypothetical protein